MDIKVTSVELATHLTLIGYAVSRVYRAGSKLIWMFGPEAKGALDQYVDRIREFRFMELQARGERRQERIHEQERRLPKLEVYKDGENGN